MDFEWDDRKAELNVRKHAVRFETAAAVFSDPFRLIFEDDRFVYDEVREIAIGMVGTRLYVVVFTEVPDAIRIVSARKASDRERKIYGNRTFPA
ncbi:BrnT family toxin [Fulvimarina endophytica]|uniref:BrnT family toxin n=1 Tax=Fulvimarina endophytica TaxID=2293836 RepID=A0A371WZU6_9HYPH|nr:BrnT family toxin [Fulvimarina endophytica]RFC62492.1 BrnT family toxin [Fulvimarina endophytica]